MPKEAIKKNKNGRGDFRHWRRANTLKIKEETNKLFQDWSKSLDITHKKNLAMLDKIQTIFNKTDNKIEKIVNDEDGYPADFFNKWDMKIKDIFQVYDERDELIDEETNKITSIASITLKETDELIDKDI